MSLDKEAIISNKNKLCIANFILFLIFILLNDAKVIFTVKGILGLVLGTLGPLFWNEWLYNELFPLSSGKLALISCRSFLLIGLLMALAVFCSLWYAFFRGTL